MQTKDQKLYKTENGKLKAEIDVYLTREKANDPSIKECRHAVLPLNNKGQGYVVYDRLLCRIVNGVYYDRQMALESAQSYNEYDGNPQDMIPNGLAMGLIYPQQKKEE